jgi:cyclic pyranopterin phosphate synthase
MTPEREITSDLLDRPMHDLRLSLTDRCNFRCPYCMPAEVFGPDHRFLESLLSFDEIETAVGAFADLGVSRVKLTGGEPLLRPGVAELIARLGLIKGLEDIALVTNGSLLAANAEALRRAGLKRVTVSLDSLDSDRYGKMSGGKGELRAVLQGLQAARDVGFAPIKLNAVVIRGVNEEDVLPLCEYARTHGHTIRFIEYMDVGHGGRWNIDRVVPSAELLGIIQRRHPLQSVNPSFRGEVASRYAFADGKGELGFITSVTEPFCGDCSRARLTADGRLYTCLFASTGVDLREALRSPEPRTEVTRSVREVWRGRNDRYAEELTQGRVADPGRVAMHYVGG